MKQTVGFIGLGGMGSALTLNLLKAGFDVRVYNRTAEKAAPLLELGATLAKSPAEAAEPGGLVATMVSDDRALEEVSLGPNGLLARLGKGVHLSMSTISPRTARSLARIHAEQGAHYVASPVFGKPEVAAQAKLWIVTSGAAEAKETAAPIRKSSTASFTAPTAIWSHRSIISRSARGRL
jgi:3-hydroxyisobutyrate dehydrogenase-like beta-hydroxyacid dehydrogenase